MSLHINKMTNELNTRNQTKIQSFTSLVLNRYYVNMKWHGCFQSHLAQCRAANIFWKNKYPTYSANLKSLVWSFGQTKQKCGQTYKNNKTEQQKKQNWREINTNKHFAIEKNNLYIILSICDLKGVKQRRYCVHDWRNLLYLIKSLTHGCCVWLKICDHKD